MVKVMIVEPDEGLSRRVVPALQHAEYEVSGARDARQALELARRWTPDVVVARVMARDPGFPKLCHLARSLGAPLIAVQPWSGDAQSRADALDIGADDCLSEPLDPRELVARIRAILRWSVPEGGKDSTSQGTTVPAAHVPKAICGQDRWYTPRFGGTAMTRTTIEMPFRSATGAWLDNRAQGSQSGRRRVSSLQELAKV